MRKITAYLLILSLCLMILAGCTSGSTTEVNPEKRDVTIEDKVTLNYNLGADPKNLDPGLNGAIDGSHIINNTFEGLLREIGGELVPAASESFAISDDGLTYTFKLRDALWSDGQAVTAQDFEYAWQRVLTPVNGAPYASHFFYIKNAEKYYNGKADLESVGIRALDEKTFEVVLESPTPYFLSLVTRPAFMPVRKDTVESAGDRWAFDSSTNISNGPFKLDKYLTGDKIVLIKNDNYWNKDQVQIDQVNCHMIIEASTALTAFQAGNLDVINIIPPQELPQLMSEDEQLHVLAMMGTYYLQFNMNVEPLDDVRVRKALSYVLDRKAITEDVQKGGEVPATGFNPTGLSDSTGRDFNLTAGTYGIEIDGGNIELAKKLLAEAGYPDGQGFPKLQTLYNTSESHKAVFEVIQETWHKHLGIDVELVNQEWAVFQANRIAHNFEIARGGYIGDYPDPVGLLELFTEDSPNNHPDWHNETFNSLISASRNASGKERDAMLYEAESILMDEAPVAPLFYYTDPVMVSSKLIDWEKNSMSYWYFGKAYLVE